MLFLLPGILSEGRYEGLQTAGCQNDKQAVKIIAI
jgi:hypothetical protein